MHPFERWETHKVLIAEAARRTRNFILATDPNSKIAQSLALGSLARAIWRQDAKLATAVLVNFAPARSFVAVRDLKVILLDSIGSASL